MHGSRHLDATRTPEERAHDLLAEMTLLEKTYQVVGVMQRFLVRPDGTDADGLDELLLHPPGHVAQLILEDAATLATMVGSIQRRFVERTRLGIPALFHAEALNGFLAGGHMSFPTPIGLAAAWSPELVGAMAELVREQMIRTGMRHALSPVMDVALDPRWGRVHETYGEDPYLVTANAVAFTRGMQTDDLAHGVIATGKHFLGYANPVGGVNASAVEVGARRLRDLFGMPFEAAIRTAGLGSVMNSYSEIDGIPVAASHEVLTGLLRDVMGFEGFVSADYASIEQLVTRQQVALDASEAGRLALTAGLDVELPIPFAYGDRLAVEVEQGRVPMGVLDLSVRRILEAKFATGLFERPYPSESIDVRAAAAEGAELSLELARRGVVVLENRGVLPLGPERRRVAVLGPHADRPALQFATYTFPSWRQAIDATRRGGDGTMVGVDATDQWVQERFAPTDPDALVRDEFGARSLADALGDTFDVVAAPGCGLTTRLGDAGLHDAIEAARSADLVVLALGGASLWFNGERTEGEASDTADPSLPAPQRELLDAVAATGTPTVVVLVQGRPVALPPAAIAADALVVAAYAGPFGGAAIADVLTGRAEPSGRLPYSVQRHVGQVPVHHHQKVGTGFRNPLPPASEGHYLDMPATPLYPFGHGRSFTTFALVDATAPTSADLFAPIPVETTLVNTGERDGVAVVQLYLRQRVSTVARPFQQLVGFARVVLRPGERRRIRFVVDPTQLAATDSRRELVVEPGGVRWVLGFDSSDEACSGTIELVGTRRVVPSDERVFLSGVEIVEP